MKNKRNELNTQIIEQKQVLCISYWNVTYLNMSSNFNPLLEITNSVQHGRSFCDSTHAFFGLL
jgi:hypothetical protein